MSDKKYKLIAFDIDGTILDENHKVCKHLKNTVAQLSSKGYIITLVSARLPSSVLEIASELGLYSTNAPMITLNGSFITNKQHDILYSKTFNADKLDIHFSKIDSNLAINYYNGFDWIIKQQTKYTDLEQNLIGIAAKFKYGRLSKVNKITLMGDNDHLMAAQKILTAADDNLLVAFSHNNYLEIATKNISKYYGLQAYAKILDIDTSQIIAFGDGENDIPMLSNVGLGVAMHNAEEHVKAAAHDVALHHAEAGVAKYLENLIAQNIL